MAALGLVPPAVLEGVCVEGGGGGWRRGGV